MFVAVFIGIVEVVGLLGQEGNLTGSGWAWVETFNINRAGFVIVGVFIVTWAVALAVWHAGKLEQKWSHGHGEGAAPTQSALAADDPAA